MNLKQQMDLLNIKDVSTPRQTKNGTVVWQLPIKCGKNKFIEVASFATGYIRNQNGGYTNYQLNKRCESEPQYYQLANGDYRKYTTRTCKLIPNEKDRLEYLIAYCLKNYYIKNANQVAEGSYVSKWYHEFELGRAKSTELEDSLEESDYRIQDLERMLEGYKTREKDLENKLDTIKRIADHG